MGLSPLYLATIREEGVLRVFIAIKNLSPWPGFEPATFGFSGQHTNHHTAKATPTIFLPKKHRSMQFVTNMKVADESAT
jgi:hypothetical protein